MYHKIWHLHFLRGRSLHPHHHHHLRNSFWSPQCNSTKSMSEMWFFSSTGCMSEMCVPILISAIFLRLSSSYSVPDTSPPTSPPHMPQDPNQQHPYYKFLSSYEDFFVGSECLSDLSVRGLGTCIGVAWNLQYKFVHKTWAQKQ